MAEDFKEIDASPCCSIKSLLLRGPQSFCLATKKDFLNERTKFIMEKLHKK